MDTLLCILDTYIVIIVSKVIFMGNEIKFSHTVRDSDITTSTLIIKVKWCRCANDCSSLRVNVIILIG